LIIEFDIDKGEACPGEDYSKPSRLFPTDKAVHRDHDYPWKFRFRHPIFLLLSLRKISTFNAFISLSVITPKCPATKIYKSIAVQTKGA